MPDSNPQDRGTVSPEEMITLVQDSDFPAVERVAAFFVWKGNQGCVKVSAGRQNGWQGTLWTHPVL